MSRAHIRRALAGLILAVMAAGGVGCGVATPPSSTAAPSTTGSSTAGSSTAAAADPVPEPPMPATPRPTAGPLTGRNLPSAGSIGSSFRPYVEPDAAEESFVSNGAPVRERDPQEVADSIGPLGCPGLDGLDPLPVPRYALEQTYRTPDLRAAVALALDYPTQSEATVMISGLARRLELCKAPPSTAALTSPRVVVDLLRHDAATLLDTRHEVGPAATRTHWDETVVRNGRRVGLVIVERAPDAPLSFQDRLASDLRQRLARP